MTLQRYQKAQEPVEFDYKETEIGEVDYDPNGDTSDCPMPAGYFYFAHETPWPYEHGIKNELVLPIEEAEKLKAALEKPSVVTQDWQPIETAPKDGTVLMFMKRHERVPEFFSAWWCPQDGVDGNMWILNDDTKDLIEEDTDLSIWYWQPIPTPPTEE